MRKCVSPPLSPNSAPGSLSLEKIAKEGGRRDWECVVHSEPSGVRFPFLPKAVVGVNGPQGERRRGRVSGKP